jgi:uncharacterized protein YfdQ (DUF2303 family)
MATTPQGGDAAAIIETVRALSAVELLPIRRGDADATHIAILPDGMEMHSLKPLLDEYLQRPERRAGTARLTDLGSFIDHANRFKDAGSAIFAAREEKAPGLVSVLDYHEAGDGIPRFGKHRGSYAFPVSEQWKAWQAVDGKEMGQGAFAALIEDRIMDILPPPADGRADAGALALDLVGTLGGRIAGPTQLLEVARGLRLTETAQVANAFNTSSGEIEVAFRTEHVSTNGKKLNVPTLFLVGMPVFEGDAAYKLPVRLQYRLKEGAISWTLRRYRPELVFFHAFDAAIGKVKAETALPVFLGAPEA